MFVCHRCFHYAAETEQELLRINRASRANAGEAPKKRAKSIEVVGRPLTSKPDFVTDFKEAERAKSPEEVDMTYAEQVKIYKTVAMERKYRDEKAERIRLLRIHQSRLGQRVEDADNDNDNIDEGEE